MLRTIALSTAVLFATLVLLMAIHGNIPATASESTPNVTGKWEGTWSHQTFGSGKVTFQLVQEGAKVTGKQSVVGVIPVYGEELQQMSIGDEVRDGHLEDSTLIFHVVAENAPGQINFTLTVSGETMTGTACGYTCATLKLKKAKF